MLRVASNMCSWQYDKNITVITNVVVGSSAFCFNSLVEGIHDCSLVSLSCRTELTIHIFEEKNHNDAAHNLRVPVFPFKMEDHTQAVRDVR